MNGEYALLWSKKQGMQHIEKVDQMLSINRLAYMDNKPTNDYIPIAMGTFEEMSETANSIRSTLIARSPDKAESLTL